MWSGKYPEADRDKSRILLEMSCFSEFVSGVYGNGPSRKEGAISFKLSNQARK